MKTTLKSMKSWKLVCAAAVLAVLVLPFWRPAPSAHAQTRPATAELEVTGIEVLSNGAVSWRADLRIDAPAGTKGSAELIVVSADDTTSYGYPEVAGNFRDTAEGESGRFDPYKNFKFRVHLDGHSYSIVLDVRIEPGQSSSAVIELD